MAVLFEFALIDDVAALDVCIVTTCPPPPPPVLLLLFKLLLTIDVITWLFWIAIGIDFEHVIDVVVVDPIAVLLLIGEFNFTIVTPPDVLSLSLLLLAVSWVDDCCWLKSIISSTYLYWGNIS